MDILPSKVPTPRLLASAAPFAPDPNHVLDTGIPEAPLARGGGLGRWWLLLIVVGAAAIVFCAHTFHWYENYRGHREVRMIQVQTHRLAAAPHSVYTPAPLTIQYAPEMLRVSAIALGHPRLAVINGRSLAEGDELVLHAPTRNVAVTLRVTRIADGYVDLSDGSQTITTHLVVPPTKSL
jgi:hypothetical protein